MRGRCWCLLVCCSQPCHEWQWARRAGGVKRRARMPMTTAHGGRGLSPLTCSPGGAVTRSA
eukprot:2862769-Alexandrium_andersonii.AAC.1